MNSTRNEASLEDLICKAMETGTEEAFDAVSGYLEQMDPDSPDDFDELQDCIRSFDFVELYRTLFDKYADRMSEEEHAKYREDYLRKFEEAGPHGRE